MPKNDRGKHYSWAGMKFYACTIWIPTEDDEMSNNQLFRQEVFEHTRNRNYGSVLINTPFYYRAVIIGFSTLAISIFLFLWLGEYTEKFIVNGYIESSKGVARIYAPKTGVIRTCFIKHGEHVMKGDKLFLIDTTDEGVKSTDKMTIFLQLKQKKKSIEREMLYKREHLAVLKKLVDKKYISSTAYHEKRDELLALKREKNAVEVELLTHKHQQSYLIRAPIDGIISSIMVHSGQYTAHSKPLIQLLPDNAHLVAKLFVPVHQSGFLHSDGPVVIRYDAYPYARFGSSNAHIHDISQSILTDAEEDKPIRIGQPYYKVTAELDQQFVNIYGHPVNIRHGMTLSAVVVGSKQTIWRWFFEPLYSFMGNQ